MRKIALLAFVPAILLAQETPTEQEAAKEVVQKEAVVVKAADAAGWIKKLTGANPTRDAVVARAKQLMDSELLAMGDDITNHPEIGWQETRSVGVLTDYLKKHNFDVTVGVADLPTAFVARWKGNNGGPNLGVILEYDALRGTQGAFHGDQHSTQGPIGMAAAIAIAEYIEKAKVPGSVIVYGTPAEEIQSPPIKAVMHKAGVFNGADVIVRSHSSSPSTFRPAPGFGTCCMNIYGVKYIFSGAPAHQMTAWAGRNALEGVIHLFENIDSIRSNLRPETRIQGIITEGGAAPNVVPDRAVADFYIRYPDEVYLQQVKEFVDNAARAAALSTGTKLKIDTYGNLRDGISISTLSELAFAYLKKYGAVKVDEKPDKPQGYDETGTVSFDIPGAMFQAHTSDSPYHTYEMLADALTDVGRQGFVVDAQAMAALLFDFLTHADYRQAVKTEWNGFHGLHDEYVQSLIKAYPKPNVPDPK